MSFNKNFIKYESNILFIYINKIELKSNYKNKDFSKN